MKKSEMITALKAAGILAVPTVITFDMGLQYDFITPDGAGTSFGGMGSWPLYAFSSIEKYKWSYIIDLIKNKALKLEDLAGTGLDDLFDSIYTLNALDPSEVFANLPEIDASLGTYYCLFDTGMCYADGDNPVFFNDENMAKEAFAERYCSDIKGRDGMKYSEVQSWYKRLKTDLNCMTYMEHEKT